MKNLFFSVIAMTGSLMLYSGCGHVHNDDTHVHDKQSPVDASHALDLLELEPLSFTIWTKRSELFVEFAPLIVGKESRFAVHFTDLANYKSIDSGEVTVMLIGENGIVSKNSVLAPSSPGIFQPSITPEHPGVYNLEFYLKTELFLDTIRISNLDVYPNEDVVQQANIPQSAGNEVTFLKEQAWKINFALAKVQKGDIQEVIRTSGEILPVESAEMAITSTTNGIILFRNKSLVEGQLVKKGTPLFTVNNDKMISSNLGEKYAIIKANLEQSKSNVDRSKELLEKGIISTKEYEIRQKEYAVYLAEHETLTSNYKSGGMTLVAPITGIIKMLNTTDGQFVTEGQSIAVISSNTQLIVEAEVSQKYFKEIANIESANIKLPWQNKVANIKDYNGRMIATSGMTKNHFIPVKFKIDNKGDLMPGTFLDVYLLTNVLKDVIIIPAEALLKDYNMYSVYVMTGGESFEGRNVTIGIQDGKRVQILSGLEEGEMVVSEGAYAIKMASMSSTIPAHGHEH